SVLCEAAWTSSCALGDWSNIVLKTSRSTRARCNALTSTRVDYLRVERVVLNALLNKMHLRCLTSASRSFHEAIDSPWPIFWTHAQTGNDWIVSDVVGLYRKLLASLVVTESVIKVAFLPDSLVFARMKALPITNDFTH